MSLRRCIDDLLAEHVINEDQAKRAAGLFDDLAGELRRNMAPDAAEALASERAVDAFDFEALRRERNALRQIDAQLRAGQWLRGGGERWGRGGGDDTILPGGGEPGKINPIAARTLIERVEMRRQTIRGDTFAYMDGLLAKMRTTVIGRLRDPALMDEIGAAAFGEHTDSLAAKELAEAWDKTGDYILARANAAGADIAKLENRGFSTSYDSRKVAELGREPLYDLMDRHLDRAKTIDYATGQPFTDAALKDFLGAIHDTLASDGALDREPGAAGRLGFANRLGQHRVLHYKSYADWKAVQDVVGAGTAWDAMMGEVEGMSRAVAAMEILGPNPEATVRYVKDLLTGDRSLFEPGQLRRRDKAAAKAIEVQRMWDEYAGALRQPESRALAEFFSGYRSIAASAKLGSASLTAMGDVGFGMATRHFNGLPVVGIMGDYLRHMKPGSEADMRTLARLGFVADTWTSRVAGQSRMLAEEIFSEHGSLAAETVLRASGVNAVTDAGRGGNAWVNLTDLYLGRDSAFSALNPRYQRMLRRYGIDEKGWNSVRTTEPQAIGGHDWIVPADIKDREIGNRVSEMIHNEGEYAVPVPDLRTRAYINAHWRKGTVVGELMRSSPLMFKTFTVAMMFRHGERMMLQPGIGGKLGYFISVIVPVTVVSAFALQLKEMAKGRDPRPMDDPRFWGQAMVQGGGSGIVGDLAGLTADNRFGGWDEYFAGPLISDAGHLAGAAGGYGRNAAHALGFNVKESEHPSWQMLKTLGDNLPGRNLWYTRLMTDRLIADQVQMLIDPKYRDSWRQTARAARDQGTASWWNHGDFAPDRAPDFANAVGAARGPNPAE